MTLLLGGCHATGSHTYTQSKSVPERTPSTEFQLTVTMEKSAIEPAHLQITLSNVGRRTLIVTTGYQHYPLAHFAFSLERPDHQWLSLYCSCAASSLFGQLEDFDVRLAPSQAHTFTLPLSALTAADPRTGDRIDLAQMRGTILVELGVPTPPYSTSDWPGYVAAWLPLR